MKPICTLLFSLLSYSISFSQITTTKFSTNKVDKGIIPYDSTRSYLGKNVYSYIGQDLYLKGSKDLKPDERYRFFFNKNTIKVLDQYNMKIDSKFSLLNKDLVGHYFTVVDVIKASHEEDVYDRTYYLVLYEKITNKLVYYFYTYSISSKMLNNKDDEQFPFIVVGYFTKLKQAHINSEFVMKGSAEIGSAYIWGLIKKINNNKDIKVITGEKWKCIDLTIEENEYLLCYVLENENGEKMLIRVDDLDNSNHYFVSIRKAKEYEKVFGSSTWNSILNGEVLPGMTKEMILLSIGKPWKIDRLGVYEHWTYDRILTFKDGILVLD